MKAPLDTMISAMFGGWLVTDYLFPLSRSLITCPGVLLTLAASRLTALTE